MKKPNFFILGAPKCGTTAMAQWLSTHPEIFISKIKEPHYYNTDHKNTIVNNDRQYFSLFEKASNKHKVVGEASVFYLYSKDAVFNIKKDLDNNDLKFLVMIRNPVEMAYSLHQQQVYNLNEPVKDFKKAWNLQVERKKGNKITLLTRNEIQLLYGDVCKLGEQLQRLFKAVDKNSVKIVLLEDLKKDPEKAYKDVLSFLNLSVDDRNDFNPINEGKSRKFVVLAMVVKTLGVIKHKLKITKGVGILNKAMEVNNTPATRDKMDVEFANELKAYFKDDVLLLSSLINKDLSCWTN